MKEIMIVILLVALGALYAQDMKLPQKAEDFFTNGYCHQTVAYTVEKGTTVKAYVDGKWQEYKLATFPPAFMKWDIGKRLQSLDDIRAMMKDMMKGGGNGKGPELAGPHNGVVATYGYPGQGSQFRLNNAVKGMGFLPRADKIDSVLAMIKKTMNDPMPAKLKNLEYMYKHANELFDLSTQLSLELYSEPKFLTQTYCNQMVNPVSTIVFLDIPSYKLKTITRLLDSNDPQLTDYEKKVCEYANLIHSYFHGDYGKNVIAVLYYAVEIYDNSPGDMKARGLMIAP